MENFEIYLAGAMGAFGVERFLEGNAWRVFIQENLPQIAEEYGAIRKPIICNPNAHFNFLDDSTYKSQREIKDFDLYKATHSKLIVVNFNRNDSIGTSKELAVCHYLGIPIIGLNEQNLELHPWDIDDCNRIFDDMNDMLEYVAKHYLLD